MTAVISKIRLRNVIGNNGGGSPRKSIEQHKLEGTYRRHRHAPVAPTLPVPPTPKASKLPRPPDDFTAEQKAVWHRLAAKLDRAAVCTALDVEAFTLMVQSYAICLEAHRSLRSLTYTIHTKRGPVKRARPEVGVLATFQKLSAYHFSRFGMTPTDRGRVLGSDAGHGVLANDPMVEFTTPPADDPEP